MTWTVRLHEAFKAEVAAMPANVRRELVAMANTLASFGPMLGRPQADTLAGSRYANMKELRFRAGGGVWRVAFAFDPQRAAILLVAGDKKGVAQTRFYRALIDKADERYAQHLADLGTTER